MVNPLVSICIPTFNGENYIGQAIESAINQSYKPLEIIISDDASTDGTLEIIQTYKSKTDIPFLIYHHTPQGIGANWNNCLKKANGEYIKFLFQDDLLNSNCIKQMMEFMLNHPEVCLLACKREFVIEDSFLNDDTKVWINKYFDLQENLNLHEYNGVTFLDKSLFKHPEFLNSPLNKVGEPSTILFRKNITKNIGYFRSDLKQILDYEFCYRALKIGKIGIFNKKLVKFRLHNNQTTILNKRIASNDYTIYYKLLYKNYFWLLSKAMKLYFLKIFNPKVYYIVIKLRLLSK